MKTPFLSIAVLATLVASVGLLAQGPDRSKPPAPGPAPALKLPAIQKSRLSNGLPVWIVELHEVPVAQVNLVVTAGSADDLPGEYGVASLTAAMLTEGAGARSSLEIADAIDFLGGDLSAAAGIDASAVRLHVPVARLADALPIMADVALRPTFPKDDLERLRQQRLTNLLQAQDDAATIAALAFSRVLYGPSHRYGTATLGTAATIATLSADDLRAFHRSLFRPDNATLLVIGDVTPQSVRPMLEKTFGSWKATGARAPRPAFPPISPPSRRQIYLVDKPDAPQSQIRIGALGAPRSTPDYFPIQVMNAILGGSFSSRLNMNLREEHGYTYGAMSLFDMRLQAGPFYAAAGVQTDKTAESLEEFFNELNGIGEPVPDDELSRAKSYIALRFPSGFETTSDISRRLEDTITYALPDDYFSRYIPAVEAVTAADVQRIARAFVRPDTAVVVVVGDRKAIEPGIQKLDLGPITVMTVEQVFGGK